MHELSVEGFHRNPSANVHNVGDTNPAQAIIRLEDTFHEGWSFFLLEPTGSMLVRPGQEEGTFDCVFFNHIKNTEGSQNIDLILSALRVIGLKMTRQEVGRNQGKPVVYADLDINNVRMYARS